jgi:hypothetical protein
LLEPYVPEDVAKVYPDEHRDGDGMFASRVWVCVVGYNTNMVKAEDAQTMPTCSSEMDRRAGEGASRPQRHHYDRDPSDVARSRLGVF